MGERVRAEEVCLREAHWQLGGDCDAGGDQDRRVRHPRLVQAEDPHEGRQEGDLRQGGDGEGEACAEDRQGLPVGRPEEEYLSRQSLPASSNPCRALLLVGDLRRWLQTVTGRAHASIGQGRVVSLALANSVFVYARGSLHSKK